MPLAVFNSFRQPALAIKWLLLWGCKIARQISPVRLDFANFQTSFEAP